MDKKDYYKVLEIERNASEDDIKKSFRRLARKYHPDANKDDPNAQKKFQEISEAYSVLSDSNKRQQYDMFGKASEANPGGAGGFGGFSQGGFNVEDLGDIFGDIFGMGGHTSRRRNSGPKRGEDIFMRLSISLKDAIFGKKTTVKLNHHSECPACHGTGANSDADIMTCPTCNGTGEVYKEVRTLLGIAKSRMTCPDCHGTGKKITKKCGVCHGEGYVSKIVHKDIEVPKGIRTGQQIKIPGFGDKGFKGGKPGDLYLEIVVKEHQIFKLNGHNLHLEVPIHFTDAIFGNIITVPTFYGNTKIKIPSDTKDGSMLKIKGKGFPDIDSHKIGDMIIKFNVVYPKKNSIKLSEKKYFKKLQESQSVQVNDSFINDTKPYMI